MEPGEKATTNNSNEEVVKAYNSLCDEYYRLLHGRPKDEQLWHSYFCSLLTNHKAPVDMNADTADKALEEYKKRWVEDD